MVKGFPMPRGLRGPQECMSEVNPGPAKPPEAPLGLYDFR